MISSTVEYSVKTTTLTCDRCGKTVLVDKFAPKADEGWLALCTPELVPIETFDLCPQCAEDFRSKFIG